MDVKGFIFDNILWDIISFSFLAIIGFIVFKVTGLRNVVELIKGFNKIKRTTFELIKVNRICRGGSGLPRHTADRFIDIWLSNEKKPIKYGKCEFSPELDRYIISFGGNRYNTAYTVKYIDDYLKDLGLVEIDISKGVVKPIRNIINKSIYKRCKNILIKYHGDAKEFYTE